MSDKRIAAAKKIIAHVAEQLKGDLSVELWNGEVVPLGPNARDDIRVKLSGPQTVRRLLTSPKLMTAFELYASGDIDLVGGSPHEAARRWNHNAALKAARELDKWLVAKNLLPFLARGGKLDAMTQKEAYETRSIAARPETGRDDKNLIEFHYDVSNAFYALFLDPEMVYSSAYFQDDDTSLEDAQIAKLDMICRRLRLKPGDRLLDIGCGWGALACHAAARYGVQVHGVTLSQKQFDYATAKVARLGLGDKVRLELKDYREIAGQGVYDKIAQIEMFEHLGIDNHERHFRHVHTLLAKQGLYLHQASTRRCTPKPENFRKPTAYQNVITRFIFPGGELDHIGMTVTNLERFGFEVHDVENWREHFQKTCALWAERLYERRAAAIEEIGWKRIRLWIAYFTLFSIGFERGTTLVFQTLASKRQIGPSGLPWTRRDLYA